MNWIDKGNKIVATIVKVDFIAIIILLIIILIQHII